MTLLKEVLNCSHSILSVIGEHAGESVNTIFHRKIADIQQTGKTFWLIKSPKAQPSQVQSICKTNLVYTIFIEPAIIGGVRPTVVDNVAREYSENGQIWHQFPERLSPVTGKLDNNAAALVFDMMMTDISGRLDLWQYADFSNMRQSIKFFLGSSTVCAVRKDMTAHPQKMKSRDRRIVGIARLVEPYSVRLR